MSLVNQIDGWTRVIASMRGSRPSTRATAKPIHQQQHVVVKKRRGQTTGFDTVNQDVLSKFIAMESCKRASRDDNVAILKATRKAALIMIAEHGAFDGPRANISIVDQAASDIEALREDPKGYEYWVNSAIQLLTEFASSLPEYIGEDDIGMTTEALGMVKNPRSLFGKMVVMMMEKRNPSFVAMKPWARSIAGNMKTIKGARIGVRADDIFPSARRVKATAYDLAHDAFRDTPLLKILSIHVPVPVPSYVRVEHANITAPSGSGKTQFLQNMLLSDLDSIRRGEASVVLFDTDGTVSENVIAVAAADPELRKRIKIVNPSMDNMRPEVNLLNLGSGSNNELVAYVMAGLGEGLTGKMTGFFDWMAIAMSQIEGATLDTLIDILSSDHEVEKYLPRVSDDVAKFLTTSFVSGNYKQTREQVSDRLSRFRTMGQLGQMFRGKQTNLDMAKILDEGSLVIIKISKLDEAQGGLGDYASLACRFFLATIVMAFRGRPNKMGASHKYWWVYLDEVADMVGGGNDKFMTEGFIQARKKKTGLIIAYQFLKQLKGELREAALGNTSLVLGGKVKKCDQEELAASMGNCSSSLFGEAKKRDRQYGEMVCWINGIVDTAAICRFPFGKLESLPTASDDEMDALMREQCAFWAEGKTERSIPEEKNVVPMQKASGEKFWLVDDGT